LEYSIKTPDNQLPDRILTSSNTQKLFLTLNHLSSTMRIRFLLSLALLATFFACKPDPNANKLAADTLSSNPTRLDGNWVALDFCSRAGQYGSVLQAESNTHRPYAFALSFSPDQPDSVQCYNGFETWKLPIKITQDTVEIQGASQGKSIFLIYDGQTNKNFTMFNGTSGQGTEMDKFLKSSVSNRNGYEAFTMALNHHLFRGAFSPIAAKGATSKVALYPEGVIKGWPEYDHYEVCTGGDCFVMGPELDIITLRNSTKAGSEKMFGFKYSAKNDTLSIMNIVDTNPNERGGYVNKGLAYRFLRKMPAK